MTPPAAALNVVDAAPRFAQDLAAIWPLAERNAEAKLGVAVSGGPDSTALLLLAAEALPGRIEAATVDHRLRPENAAEAAAVARICAAMGVPHAILPVDVAMGNLQAEARRARYTALAGWADSHGLAAIATAHHADDQAETLLQRLNRASGVAGLAGTRARGVVPGTNLPLLRPLLGWRRMNLAAVVVDAGVTVFDDPSNRDDRFDRARLRKAMAGADWLAVAAIAQSAAHLADADAALDWAARREWAEQVREEALNILYRPQAPRAVALRVIVRIVRRLGGENPRGSAVASVFEALLAGRPASIGTLVARPGPSGWSFAKAPRRAAKRNDIEPSPDTASG